MSAGGRSLLPRKPCRTGRWRGRSRPALQMSWRCRSQAWSASDLTLPAPGLPDEPTYTGDPVAYVAEAPDGEPAVEAALAWQPEIEPDPEQQPDPEFIAAADADPAQPMQAEAAIETIALAPGAEPPHEVAPVTHAPGELPADEPPAEPTAIEQFVADEPALAEQLSTEPISAEEEPAVPIAETRGEAPWPEQPTAELPTTDEPISDEPTPSHQCRSLPSPSRQRPNRHRSRAKNRQHKPRHCPRRVAGRDALARACGD